MNVRVLHIITGLGVGGAELTLQRLLPRLGGDALVVSLMELGPVGARLRAQGVPVEALGLRPAMPDPRALLRLRALLRAFAPDLVQTWMYHANLLGGLAVAGSGVPQLWNLRQSNLDPGRSKRSTILVMRAGALLSRRLPRGIVCCSAAVAETHASLGYDARRMVVIENGVDDGEFRPDPAARAQLRRELGLPPDATLVGLVARYHPQKDHPTFLRAAARLAAEVPDARFLLCGEGVEPGNGELATEVRALGLEPRVSLLGVRADVARVTAACDVAVSSSAFGEGFPNAVAEAMACGVPCVATAVGATPALLDDSARVVPIGDPAALAAAMLRLLRLTPDERRRVGERDRQRVLERWSMGRAVTAYRELYEATVGAPRTPARPTLRPVPS